MQAVRLKIQLSISRSYFEYASGQSQECQMINIRVYLCTEAFGEYYAHRGTWWAKLYFYQHF